MKFVDIAKDFLSIVKSDLDQHTSDKGEIVVNNPASVSMFTPSHVQFAKYGRGPGKNPPRSRILAFVKKKGIIFDGLDEEGTAIAIQMSIGKKGTLNYVPNAPDAIEESLDKAFEQYSKALSDLFSLDTEERVYKIWEDNLPDEDFKI